MDAPASPGRREIADQVVKDPGVRAGDACYLGGQSQSSLTIDFVLPDATLLIDGESIVE